MKKKQYIQNMSLAVNIQFDIIFYILSFIYMYLYNIYKCICPIYLPGIDKLYRVQLSFQFGNRSYLLLQVNTTFSVVFQQQNRIL